MRERHTHRSKSASILPGLDREPGLCEHVFGRVAELAMRGIERAIENPFVLNRADPDRFPYGNTGGRLDRFWRLQRCGIIEQTAIFRDVPRRALGMSIFQLKRHARRTISASKQISRSIASDLLRPHESARRAPGQ